MELREVCKILNTTAPVMYLKMNTTQDKLSYHKRNNPEAYKNMITYGIVNYYNIEHSELIKILEEYKKEK